MPPPSPLRRRRPLRAVACALAALALAPVLGGPAAQAWQGPWQAPLEEPVRVLRPFDPPQQPWLPGHRGVDLAADPGAEVRAAAAGRVAFAGTVAGTGVVSIAHGGLRTTYLPVEPRVQRGRQVAAGRPVATVARSRRHCGAHPCLHWGLRCGDAYLDPLALLGLGRVRLLPLTAAR